MGKGISETTAHFQISLETGPQEEKGDGEEFRVLVGGGSLKVWMRTLCLPDGVLSLEANTSSSVLSVSPHGMVHTLAQKTYLKMRLMDL